jgi:hypothetical protein
MLQQGSLSTVMVDGHRGLRTGGLSQTVLQIKFKNNKIELTLISTLFQNNFTSVAAIQSFFI